MSFLGHIRLKVSWMWAVATGNSQKILILALRQTGGGNSPLDSNKISYTGYDVASYVIKNNTQKYSKENIKFIHYDGDFSTLKSADLLLCKDCLQHLPNAKIKEFISILPRYKYALITNDINCPKEFGLTLNSDILATEYRPIDLRKPPFNVPLEIVYTIARMPEGGDITTMLYVNKDV